jgi:hypothetical protein
LDTDWAALKAGLAACVRPARERGQELVQCHVRIGFSLPPAQNSSSQIMLGLMALRRSQGERAGTKHQLRSKLSRAQSHKTMRAC